jgi:predicted DsbA family dithiol-disulfide isomerase
MLSNILCLTCWLTNRRINEIIGIRYDDIAQMPIIVEEVEMMLKTHKEIDQSEPLDKGIIFEYVAFALGKRFPPHAQ